MRTTASNLRHAARVEPKNRRPTFPTALSSVVAPRPAAEGFRAIGVDQPLDLRRVLAQPLVLCREFREELLQLSLHLTAQPPLVAFSGEVLGIERNAHSASVGGGIFPGVQHRDLHLTWERQQRVPFGRAGSPGDIEPIDGVEESAAERDGVNGATVSPVRLGHLDVPGTAGDRQSAPDDAAAEGSNVQIGRLRDDGAVGSVAAVNQCQGPHATRLFVDDRGENDIATQAHPSSPQDLQGGDGSGQAGLHVSRTPAVDHPVMPSRREGVNRPALPGAHDVDMTKEQQRPPATAPGQGCRKVRATTEIAIRVVTGSTRVSSQLDGVGLPLIEPSAETLESTGEDALDITFAGRLLRTGEIRVHAGNADEILQQCDRLLVVAGHGRGDGVEESRSRRSREDPSRRLPSRRLLAAVSPSCPASVPSQSPPAKTRRGLSTKSVSMSGCVNPWRRSRGTKWSRM